MVVDMVVYTPTLIKPTRLCSYRPGIVSSILCIIFVVYFVSVLFTPKVPAFIAPTSSYDDLSVGAPSAVLFATPVLKLISDLRQATQTAEGGGLPFPYTAKERQKWTKENPCRGRAELPLLYASRHVRDLEPNLEWRAVLDEYSKLHRACINKIGNLTEYFLSGSTVPGCKFITGESLFGLGNKITFSASLVLYAILTQRVVLFPKWSASIPAVMCEPFEGSSWELPLELEFLNKRPQKEFINDLKTSNTTERFLALVDEEKARWSDSSLKKMAQKVYYTEVDDGWHPVDRFFCDAEQEIISQVRWMSMAGCLYFMPKIFAIPMFRHTLEALFPDRMALTHVLRSVFIPYDAAWDRIDRLYDMHMEKADRRVSVQVRYRNGASEHSQLSTYVNEHITRCLLENRILPNISEAYSDELAFSRPTPPRIIKVLITSLHMDFHDQLQEMYLRHQTVTGESVGLFQPTHDDDQQWGLEPDTQALVEMLLLSLSDTLLVTPLSTFGGVAQAYGALTPWIIEQNDGNGSCVRAQSVDMCYQGASLKYSCPHDQALHGRSIPRTVAYIRPCLAVDSKTGVQLITG